VRFYALIRYAAVLGVFTAAGLASAAPTAIPSASSAGGDSILFLAKSTGAHEIREIGADGRGEHVVRTLPSSFWCCSDWSPTKAAIAFLDEHGNLFVMRIGDGVSTLVARRAGFPAWSPDGRQVAYIAGRPGLEIFIVNADGTARRKITGPHPRTTSGIHRISPLGSSPDRRTVVYINYSDLAWSPDKRNLVYLRSQAYDTRHPPIAARLYLISAAGGRSRTLPRLSGFVPGVLAWSPNSARIAVGGYRDVGVTLVSASGKAKEHLSSTDCCTGIHGLAWSPDGNEIVFFGDGSVGPDGGIVNVDGSHLRVLHIAGYGRPAWSPDGKMIAFEGTPGTLNVINADGTGLQLLAKASPGASPIWT
jgi:Tol biopolymer transport system component